ncbi:GntR family transcriptional regulator [Blastococcus sp. PRF04-17]|uniref:GntR family transcriptional regulator n=1 Tax=Blastococcus sp. PRF04-17 TaxID=2933797 RepID=UPI001FF12884|nr:GntR family transcriptional regulator [Blastococcus sp. PRF04-17]UOY01542.1 GntR family transcriptional regulator [Blastococcus sp. PRF04-17]
MTARPSVRVVTTDPTPPYEQLRRQFVDLIWAGVLTPGDRLPPLRQLAADLGLAVGTVGRAYRELEAAGLVASRRGGGTRVLAARNSAVDRDRTLRQHAETFVRQARLLGADDDDVRAALSAALGQPSARH